MNKIEYLTFLRSKLPTAERAGIEPPTACHDSLKPHQRDIAEWAIRGGRRAIFASFGLGKTRIHLQVAQWVVEHFRGRHLSSGLETNQCIFKGCEDFREPAECVRAGATRGKFLIVAPLGVRREFTHNDGPAMGLKVQYVRTMAEAEAAEADILITNYERVRDGDLDPQAFAGAGLDESSVLRSFGSITYQTFLTKFAGVPFRFVFTATPSPNRYKELIHYAGFLGVMDTGEALTRFFQRDSSEAGNLTLYPHMEGQFWHWLRSWAVFIQSPADLGYDSTGYDLPPVTVRWHRVEIDHTANWTPATGFDGWGQGQLFVDAAQGLSQAAAVKRDSISLRIEKAKEIMGMTKSEGQNPKGRKKRHWLLWHDLEAERKAIEKEIPEAVTVWGSQDLEEREDRIQDFAKGKIRLLATKPIIAGSGCNFQHHCADAIFLGVGYKFNDMIQAVHRIVRFQQASECHIHFIYTDTEDLIKDELEAKWRRHDELVARMTELLRTHRLDPDNIELLKRTIGVVRDERRAAA